MTYVIFYKKVTATTTNPRSVFCFIFKVIMVLVFSFAGNCVQKMVSLLPFPFSPVMKFILL